MRSVGKVDHVVRPKVGLRVRWVCNQDDKGMGDKDDEDGAMAADDDEVPDEEFGNRKVKKVQDPKEPSKEEKLEHEMTHLPHRSGAGTASGGEGSRCRTVKVPRSP